jgi:hypothetical protein
LRFGYVFFGLKGEPKFYLISTPLTDGLGQNGDFIEIVLTRSERHGRVEPLFSIERQFAKVEVAGSNPVSRS